MKTGGRWSSWKAFPAVPFLCGLLLSHASGCAKDRSLIEQNLMAQQSLDRKEDVVNHYRVGCPDTIALEVAERTEFNGSHDIGPDGRIDLGDYGTLRIEGRTIGEIAKLLSTEIGVEPDHIHVRVVAYRSTHLLLFGEVIGWQRSVPYHGQETVLDLLQRVGGITKGAEPRDVYVVRPHLGESQRPEVFHVDLRAIVVNNDSRTNIRLLPFDQIYVGETRRSQIEKAIPPWLRAFIPEAKFRTAQPQL
jgi:protein involved in polysaccharide export with SLBB domain